MSIMRKVKRRGKKLRGSVSASTGLGFAADRRVFRATAAATRPGTDAYHVLVAPPGGGNIGDQAMVEAFLENTTAPVRIVTRGPDDIAVPAEHADRAEIVPLAGLLYGDGAVHSESIADYRRLLGGARSVTVVGADIMDGAYNTRASARRADVTTLARSIDLDARVLGFSWNGYAHPAAKAALARAGAAGTALLLRDPLSAARARADGLKGVREVADSVFSARTSLDTARNRYVADPDAPYAVVNASGLVGRSMDQVTEYGRIVRHLLDRGLTVVLLPHVVRSSADDMAACEAVRDAVDDPGVVLVDRVLRPGEVRGLVSGAAVVLTGRMHLAIQSFWNGVPAITLSTQGKVEGLMRLFGTESLCVEPGAGLADRIIPVVDQLIDDAAAARELIQRGLPAVRALADANFDGLEGAPEGARNGARA